MISIVLSFGISDFAGAVVSGMASNFVSDFNFWLRKILFVT